ncbi:MAG: hypothetical protein JXA24_06570 [Proteobacteria bacterium]|nr:hypothetical protein [Pseudomonadota bacterium]
MKRFVSIIAIIFVAALSGGCGGGGEGPAPGDTTTISGTLVEGAVDPVGSASAKVAQAKAAGDPLVGYQLYCVTFSTPPLGAAGTSGADGSVTLTIDAASATFGCFILDPAGASVATLIFVNDDASSFGQTVTASGTVGLGQINVQLDTGAARVTVPSGVTISPTPASAECPEGTWLTDEFAQAPSCPIGQKTKSTVWMVKKPDGKYEASFTTYNVGIYETCSIGSKSGMAVETAGNVASFSFPFSFESDDPCYDEKIATLIVTTNEECTQGEASIAVDNCGSCDPDTICNDCGSETCVVTGIQVTRE